jgi:hypothetical protein
MANSNVGCQHSFLEILFNEVSLNVLLSSHPMTNQRPLLLLEANEASCSLFEVYAAEFPSSQLAQILQQSICTPTEFSTTYELNWWSAWATLYLGVGPDEHTLVNQNVLNAASTHQSFWQLLQTHGLAVGLFGTAGAHIWEPLRNKTLAFFLPDKYAPHILPFPNTLRGYAAIKSRISLTNDGYSQCKQVLSSLPLLPLLLRHLQFDHLKLLIPSLRNTPHSKSTLLARARLAHKIDLEKFLLQYKRTKPDFASFDMNLIGTGQHIFLGEWLACNTAARRHHPLTTLMHDFDNSLGLLLRACKKHNANFMIASGIGQKPNIDNASTQLAPQWLLNDLPRLLHTIDFPHPVTRSHTMRPNITLLCRNETEARDLKTSLETLHTSVGKIFSVAQSDYQLTLLVNEPALAPYEKPEAKLELRKVAQNDMEKLGLKLSFTPILNGVHDSRGLLTYLRIDQFKSPDIHRKASSPHFNKPAVDLRHVLPTLLGYFEIEPLAYMAAPTAALLGK